MVKTGKSHYYTSIMPYSESQATKHFVWFIYTHNLAMTSFFSRWVRKVHSNHMIMQVILVYVYVSIDKTFEIYATPDFILTQTHYDRITRGWTTENYRTMSKYCLNACPKLLSNLITGCVCSHIHHLDSASSTSSFLFLFL